MKNRSVRRYEPAFATQWNAFVEGARNATFLFDRKYMEYHSDRFEDFSLIVEEDGKWMAVLPANKEGNVVVSHRGLTYGGLVYGDDVRQETVIRIFSELLVFLERQGIDKLVVKSLPYIFHRKPSQETEYALFLAKATLFRRDTASVIDLSHPSGIYPNRIQGVKKGERSGLVLQRESDATAFWKDLLIPLLHSRHEAKPVHSLAEIQVLMERFPENIQLFVATENGKIVAGTVLYITENVVHTQYIASDDDRNKNGSLDFLHAKVIEKFTGQKRWFDFGTSNAAEGRQLNSGLAYWKETFGCGTVNHDFYEVETAHHSLLQNVIL